MICKQNIEKAKKEIEKLEQEATEASASASVRAGRTDRAKKVALKNTGVNGDPSAEAEEEQDVADVSKELKATKIEDEETVEVETA